MNNNRLRTPAVQVSALSLALATLAGTPMAVMGQQLEEIMVTATRRVESLQDVPLAVSAISGKDLENNGVFETSDMNRIAPNLQVSSPYGKQQPNFSVRGVGVGTEFNANSASPIGVYVDEVYQTFRASHGQQLFDLEQVEILRGPQGTLFGRNTTGGAINFITNKPQMEDLQGTIAVGYGNYSRKSVEGVVDFTPVQDKFGVRLSGTYEEADPFVENKLPKGLNTAAAGGASGLNLDSGIDPGGWENYGVRGIFRFMPNDDIDMMLKGYKAESKGGTEVPIPTGQSKNSDVIDYLNPNFLLSGLFQGLAPAGLLPASYSQKGNGLDLRDVQVDSLGDAKTEAQGVVFTANVALNENLDFIAVTGYDSGKYLQSPTTDCDATPLTLCTIGYDSDFDAYNIDIRLDYQSGPLKLVGGMFYGQDSITADNLPNFFNFTSDVNAALGMPAGYFNPGGAFNGAGLSASSLPTGIKATQHFKQERESYAFYTEANYDLTNSVTLTAGLRYSNDSNDFKDGRTTYYDDTGTARLLTVSNYQLGGAYAPYFLEDVYDEAGNLVIPAAAASPGPLPGGLEQDGSTDSWSGRFIVDWTPMDALMLYASYSRGYRSGTFNGLAYGSANQVYFVDPEQVDAYEAGFKSRFLEDRVQVNSALFYYAYEGQQGQVVDNTATANLISLDGSITGLEIETQWLVTERLTLSAAAGWLDSEYDNDTCPDAPITGFPAQKGSCVVSSGGQVNVGGNPFPFAAKSTYNLGFDWDVAEIGEGTVTLHGDAAYTGDFYYDSFKNYSRGPLTSVTTGKFTEGEGDYWVANANLSYTTDSYSVSAWVKNMTDEEYYPYGISIENLFANGYRVLAPPRTYGATFRYNF